MDPNCLFHIKEIEKGLYYNELKIWTYTIKCFRVAPYNDTDCLGRLPCKAWIHVVQVVRALVVKSEVSGSSPSPHKFFLSFFKQTSFLFGSACIYPRGRISVPRLVFCLGFPRKNFSRVLKQEEGAQEKGPGEAVAWGWPWLPRQPDIYSLKFVTKLRDQPRQRQSKRKTEQAKRYKFYLR